MSDEEIIKAIEGCIKAGACHECENKRCYGINDMMKAALALIQRQQEEIKKYKQTITVLKGLVEIWEAVQR